MKRSLILDEIVNDIDLNRIRNLPVTEKFKLIEYVKLIYTEAEFASKEGFLKLKHSENYTANKTYNLFAMLLVNVGEYDLVKEIILNYARNFENSDIYYSQITITGMGLLMIEKQFAPEAVLHFLLSLLGEEFLVDNLHISGDVNEIDNEDFKLDSTIKYKPFEGRMREIKYDLLALLKLSHEKTIPFVKYIINNSYGNERLKYYFNMLDSNSDSTMEYLNREFMNKDNRTQKLLAAGAYAILNEKSILSTHYLFNSIIGKYSRFDKRHEEMEKEIEERLYLIKENDK